MCRNSSAVLSARARGGRASHSPCHAGADLRAMLVKHIGAPLVDTYMSVWPRTLLLLTQRMHYCCMTDTADNQHRKWPIICFPLETCLCMTIIAQPLCLLADHWKPSKQSAALLLAAAGMAAGFLWRGGAHQLWHQRAVCLGLYKTLRSPAKAHLQSLAAGSARRGGALQGRRPQDGHPRAVQPLLRGAAAVAAGARGCSPTRLLCQPPRMRPAAACAPASCAQALLFPHRQPDAALCCYRHSIRLVVLHSGMQRARKVCL